MGDIIRLDTRIVKSLSGDTIELIHATSSINAMKLLICSYDILELNLLLATRYAFPVWDKSALQQLDHNRRYLLLDYQNEFRPSSKQLLFWSKKINDLLKITAA